LFPSILGKHGRSQSEATPGGSLPIHYAPCPIKVIISLQSHVNTASISHTMSNYVSQGSQHMLRSNPICLSRHNCELAKCTHYIIIYSMVLTRYINDPISGLYIVGYISSESEEDTLRFFRFVTIGVARGLQFNIPNFFNISIVYFP